MMRPLRDGLRIPQHDERGGTLVVVCVMLVVMSSMFVATLDFANSTTRSQKVLQEKSDDEESAKNAIDSTVERLRAATDKAQGRDVDLGAATNCQDRNLDFSTATSGSAYSIGGAGEASGITVYCKPEFRSGRVTNRLGDALAPSQVIATVGGVSGDGNENGTDAQDALPFCDDTHDRQQQVGASCEAGVYVDPSSTGVVIGGNPGGSHPAIFSNSAIVAMAPFQVMGIVEARRSCIGSITGGYSLTQSAPAGGWVQCENVGTAPTTKLQLPYPSASTFPYSLGTAAENATKYDVIDPAVDSNTLTRQSIPACDNTGPGYTTFLPGTYSSQSGMKSLMDTCKDSMFYFKPGSYYFDFTDGLSDMPWTPPASDPAGGSASSKYIPSMILGGAVPKNAAGTDDTWKPCSGGAGGTCPDQPQRPMYFNLDTYTGNSAWSNIDKATDIEGTGTTYADTFTGSGTAVNINWSQPETPIPERGGTVVKKLAVEFSHQEPQPASYYDAGFPRLTFTISGSGSCTLPLTKSQSVMKKDTFTLFDGTSNPQTFKCEYTNGANTLVPGIAQNGWENSMKMLAAHPESVNILQVKYEVRAANNTNKVHGYVDGLNALVTYKGRPAPNFPGGCDTTTSGVQFIFGANTRLNFNDKNAYTELCGRFGDTDLGARTGADYPVAIYGLDERSADITSPATRENIAAGATVSAATADWGSVASASATNVADIDGNQATASWTSGTPSLSYKIPAGKIPDDAIITEVAIKVKHDEQLANTKITITPADAGLTPWTHTFNNSGVSTTSNWGNFSNNSTGIPKSGWSTERELTDWAKSNLYLNGATVKYELVGASTGSARLDGLEVWVRYRRAKTTDATPKGVFRPLRGCLTTRAANNPYDAASGTLMAGLDREWAPNNASAASDRTYTTGAGTQDSKDCALVKVSNPGNANGSDQTPGQQFRVDGMVYAPTAALDFSGSDNEGPFVTAGIVARHLTILKWVAPAGTCTIGSSCYDTTFTCRDRTVQLSAWKDGVELERERVTFGDNSCAPNYSSSAAVNWTVLRPGS